MITENAKSVISDLASGDAFDRAMQAGVDGLASEWGGLDQNNLFGNRSPLHGSLDEMFDDTPHDIASIGSLDISDRLGEPISLPQDAANSLIGTPKGALSSISQQMGSQVDGLMDNLKVFSSHQQTLNDLGEGTGCSSMNNTFGTIAAFGKSISDTARNVTNSINSFKQLKAQLQSEITNFDNNVIGILTGQINGTVLSELVAGSGLHDQIDKILEDSGIAQNSAEAQQIKSDVGAALTNPELMDYFVTKDLTYQNLKQLKNEAGEIVRQIGTEKITIGSALTKLRQVSDGLTMLGMFKSNPCVQTVVGFNGTDNFISKLGQD